nr:solute carrier family 2, facilitated glucose transporter member 12-like [Oncorhynchus nerka]
MVPLQRGLVCNIYYGPPAERIGVPNVMFLYATISFILLVFVILFIPETQGRTLEQISKELAKKKQLKVRFWRRVQPQETLFTIHRTPELATLNPHPLT